MNAKVKKDITRRYNAMLAGLSEDNKGQTDCYQCQQCNNVTKTVIVDNGITPMGIECPYCHGEAIHQDTDYPNIKVTHEWYRPSLDETLALSDSQFFTMSMVLQGGLLRREKR